MDRIKLIPALAITVLTVSCGSSDSQDENGNPSSCSNISNMISVEITDVLHDVKIVDANVGFTFDQSNYEHLMSYNIETERYEEEYEGIMSNIDISLEKPEYRTISITSVESINREETETGCSAQIYYSYIYELCPADSICN